jgi:pimeloyl-ACP methyl ester carboxylesterase
MEFRLSKVGVVVSVSVKKSSLSIDVSEVAPTGCNQVAMDLFVPTAMKDDPLLWICVPGGGINRQYFDLDVPGQDGSYSMARFLAGRGDLVVTVDPPGVGGSDTPDDGYSLSPHGVADVLGEAIRRLDAELLRGGVGELGPMPPRFKIGLGHSAGALLVACQQARHTSFCALALLGFSASGLPGVLNEEELQFAGKPDQLVQALPNLTKERFGDPLPQWANSSASDLGPIAIGPQIDQALAAATSNLLALVGMAAIVPGSVQPELNELRVPIFAALGQHDLAGTLGALAYQLPGCGDLTLFLLEGAGHSHNIASNRQVLWQRIGRWAISLTS